ncbi:threonine/homoserine efflux transporter RhtA [Knoellia remsis]|uniref:Threonine/homoserine efflux transporter RhtA n=1 Tax=Knoellia remsis TaxID=407159 RepID=A0A2T0UXI0_9MICO|nr:DMT family transporter [Knoellia remsis]PRY62633.1 threonine/homoserine efflux transporter RhtA [Knoellia remsis]
MTRPAPAPAVDRHSRLAVLLLLAVTAVWGSTFFLIRDLVEHVPSADFLAVRFAIAAVLMFVVFHRQTLALTRRQLALGAGLGVLYAVAQLLQTVGLETTAASVSGFLTGTYIVLTPVLGALLLKDEIPRTAWVAAVIAMVGIGVLSLSGLAMGFGEALTLGSALVYALHILALGRWSTARTALGLSTVQAAVIAVVCGAAALPDGLTLPATGGQWMSLLYMAVVAGAGALIAQTWAQAHLTATRAAIVMAMEPVFAALFAVLLGGESVTWRLLVGGSLVLGAMYLVELRATSHDDDLTALEDPPAEALHHDV